MTQSKKHFATVRPRTYFKTKLSAVEKVAALAGVSKATVSRVVNSPAAVSPETAERVRQAIADLRYRPTRASSTLRSGRSAQVALMMPHSTSTFMGSVADCIERALYAIGRTMVLCTTGEDPSVQDDLLREMRSQRSAGIIMVAGVVSPELEGSIEAGLPIIAVNRRLPTVRRVPYIGIDDAAASAEAARYFIARGFGDIWIVHGNLQHAATADRLSGFMNTLSSEPTADRRVQTMGLTGSRREFSYALAVARLERTNAPQAIFCTTDEIAYGVLRRCYEIGLIPPKDIYLFGFDGSPLNDYVAPWLGEIVIPYEKFGEAVVSMLQKMWTPDGTEVEDVTLPFQLVTGVSD